MGWLVRAVKHGLLVGVALLGFFLGLLQTVWLLARGRRAPRVERQEEFTEEDAEVIEIRGGRVYFRSKRPVEIKESILRGHSAPLPLAIPLTPWMKK